MLKLSPSILKEICAADAAGKNVTLPFINRKLRGHSIMTSAMEKLPVVTLTEF